jgi:hypothetical protein
VRKGETILFDCARFAADPDWIFAAESGLRAVEGSGRSRLSGRHGGRLRADR